jgi:hypothetical protein
MRIEHVEHIDAPADVVWGLTIDIAAWPTLMPTVRSVARLDDGPLRAGSEARLVQPGLRPTTWTVRTVDAPRRFVWQARLLGVVTTAMHEIEPDGTGCRNTLALELGGWRGRLLGAVAGRRLRRTLAIENASFRAAAERQVAAPA